MQQQLRIVVHDYSGHPGQLDLSRALAAEGHVVVHQHCPAYVSGKGEVERRAGDPDTFSTTAVSMNAPFRRYSPLGRFRQEVVYGVHAGKAILSANPDIAILSNIPLLAHAITMVMLRARGVPTIFWHQDVYSAGIGNAARRRLPIIGRAVGWIAELIEARVARSSRAVIPISIRFVPKLEAWGVPTDRITVIGNWGPVEDIERGDKRNLWSEQYGLGDRPVVLYSGTLGLKHDPRMLSELADRLAKSMPDARIVIISEGSGRHWLESWKTSSNNLNMLLLDYQEYRDMSNVLASADVLVAVLEPDASEYSVPSKVLTYMCAGRPVIAAMPISNPAALTITGAGAGFVVDSSDSVGFADAVVDLLGDPTAREMMGRSARNFAEMNFSSSAVVGQFISVIEKVLMIEGS